MSGKLDSDRPKDRRRVRLKEPFAIVTQRELGLFADVGADPIHLAAIVALRARSDPDGWTRVGLDVLAASALMEPRTLSRAIGELTEKGLVTVRRIPKKGGGWSFQRACPVDAASESLRAQASTSTPVEVPTPAESTPVDARVHAKNATSGRLATRDNPDVPPDIYPVVVDDERKDAGIALAMRALAELEEYPFDRGADLAMLCAVRRRRSLVAIGREVDAWIEDGREGARSQRVALRGWLEKTAEDVAPDELERFCGAAGCAEILRGEVYCDRHGEELCAGCHHRRDRHEARCQDAGLVDRERDGRTERVAVWCRCDGFVVAIEVSA